MKKCELSVVGYNTHSYNSNNTKKIFVKTEHFYAWQNSKKKFLFSLMQRKSLQCPPWLQPPTFYFDFCTIHIYLFWRRPQFDSVMFSKGQSISCIWVAIIVWSSLLHEDLRFLSWWMRRWLSSASWVSIFFFLGDVLAYSRKSYISRSEEDASCR